MFRLGLEGHLQFIYQTTDLYYDVYVIKFTCRGILGHRQFSHPTPEAHGICRIHSVSRPCTFSVYTQTYLGGLARSQTEV